MTKRIICVLLMISLLFALSSVAFAAIEAVDMSDNTSTTQVRLQSATGVTFLRNQPGIAGKSSSDTIQILDVASDASSITGTGGSYPRFEIIHGLNFATNKISTFQFNIYADANVVAGLTFHWSDVLVWKADGTVQYKYYKSDSEKAATSAAGSLERGKWHTIALTYDYDNDIQHIYADGELLASCKRAGGYTSSTVGSHTSMRIGAYSGSKEGRLAIDNVFAYKGTYKADDDKLRITESETISVDMQNNTIVYDEEAVLDVASLKSQIMTATGAAKAEIFNKDFSAPEQALPTDAMCVLTAPSGVSIYCFKLQPLFGIGTPELVSSEGLVGAKAVAFNNRTSSRPLTMIMAVRDADGCLEKVYSSQEYSFKGEQELTIASVDIGSGSAYVFFIENWQTLRAVSSVVTKIK